jgi:ATP-dependent Clp protease ATP-binding subunit ClpA
MLEHCSEEARRTILFGRYEAAQLGSAEILPEHILLGLFQADSNIPSSLTVGVSIKEIRDEILAYLSQSSNQPDASHISLSPESQELLATARDEAGRIGKPYVDNHHLLLALARMENSFAAQVLRRSGLSIDNLRQQMQHLREETREEVAPRKLANAVANLSPAERKLYEVEGRLLELFRLDDYEGALKLVDDTIADPAFERNQTVRMLTPIASKIARIISDLDVVKHYCELLLACDPDNQMGLFTLADCLSLQGKKEEAMEIANKAHELSLAQGSVQARSLAKLIEHRFPEIKSEM